MTAVVKMMDEKPQTFRSKKIFSSDEEKHHITLDGNIRLLDVINFEAETMTCSFSGDGNLLAIGLASGSVKIFSIESKAIVYHLEPDESKLPVTSLKWRPNQENQALGNVLLVTYASGYVKRFHITSNKLLSKYFVDSQVMTSAYSSDGFHSICGCSDGKIVMFDENTNKLLMDFEPSTNTDRMDGHMMRVFAVQYHPHDDHLFISGGWDDTIQWWDTRVNKKHSIKKIVGPHICGEGLHVDGTSLNMVAASWRKSHNLQVFDFKTGKLIKEIEQDYNKTMLYCALWENKESIICGGSHSNVLRIISYVTLQATGTVDNLPGAVYSIDYSNQGSRKLISFCSSRSLYLVEDTN